MAITSTVQYYRGLMDAGTMKKTNKKLTYNNMDYYFYTYSIDVPFTPQENPGFENVEFLDVHGNKYSTADNIIVQKVDIGVYLSDTGRFLYLSNATNLDPEMHQIGVYTVAGGAPAQTFYKFDTDPFDNFVYEPLLNGTDGFTPWDILKPSNTLLMPFPVYIYGVTEKNVSLAALQTLTNTGATVETLCLTKLNEPLFFTSNSYYLMRSICYAKPF